LVENLKGKHHLIDLDLEGMITFKYNLEKQGVRDSINPAWDEINYQGFVVTVVNIQVM
jgi:hypothetical protein